MSRPSRPCCVLSALLLLLVCSTPAFATAPATQPASPTPAQIAAWIAQLGSDDFATRQAAEARLSAAGLPAYAAVQEAQRRSPDAEVRERTAHILRAIDRTLAHQRRVEQRRALAAAAATAPEQVLWSRPDLTLSSPPAAGHGVLVFGAKTQGLTCLDRATGKPRWSLPAEYVDATPALDADRVYAINRKRELLAVELSTGQEKWRLPPRPETEAWYQVATAGGHVLTSGTGATLLALQPATGAVSWQIKHNRPLTTTPPVVGDTLLLASFCQGHLAAVDLKTGADRWRIRQLPGPNLSGPARDGLWFVGAPPGIFAFDIATGRLKWEARTATVIHDLGADPLDDTGGAMGISAPPAADADHVYLPTNVGLLAIARQDGKPCWRFIPEDLKQPIDPSQPYPPGLLRLAPDFSTPAPCGALVLVAGRDGLHALDRRTGFERWRLPSLADAQLLADGDQVYAGRFPRSLPPADRTSSPGLTALRPH